MRDRDAWIGCWQREPVDGRGGPGAGPTERRPREDLDRSDADFAGSVVALGALGIVTRVTLDIEPTYDVRQYVYEGLPLDHLADHLNEVLGAAYSVSVFTDWADTSINNQIWLKQKVFDDLTVVPTTWHGASLADGPRHPVPGMAAENCTEQLGVPGPWNQRLPHFRAGFQPSSGDEIQSEFFVAAEHAPDAFEAVRAIKDQITPVLQISEIRAIAADSLWLSPAIRSGHRGDPLHLHPGRGWSREGCRRGRAGPGTVRSTTTLGQGVQP